MVRANLTQDELREMGFASFGPDVLISRKASFHGAERIRLGNLVRIDDFCVLSAGSGGIVIGNRVHVAVYSSLIGKGMIELHDYANISSRVSIYSSNDDYSGTTMTNPMVPEQYTGVVHADVVIGRHAVIGSGSVVLPGVEVGEGAAVGALSLVRFPCESFSIYAGVPARKIGTRSRGLLEMERRLLTDGNR